MSKRKYEMSFGALAALVWATSACAADLPVRTQPPAATVYAPLYNWTGLYVGANIGGVWGTGSTTVNSFVGGVPALTDYFPEQAGRRTERLAGRSAGRLQLSDEFLRARRGNRLRLDRFATFRQLYERCASRRARWRHHHDIRLRPHGLARNAASARRFSSDRRQSPDDLRNRRTGLRRRPQFWQRRRERNCLVLVWGRQPDQDGMDDWRRSRIRHHQQHLVARRISLLQPGQPDRRPPYPTPLPPQLSQASMSRRRRNWTARSSASPPITSSDRRRLPEKGLPLCLPTRPLETARNGRQETSCLDLSMCKRGGRTTNHVIPGTSARSPRWWERSNANARGRSRRD